FLVDTKGRVAWIGHPMSLNEKIVDEVLAAKFDIEKAAKDYVRQNKKEWEVREIRRDMQRAIREKNWEQATDKVAELEKLMPEQARASLDMTRLDILFGKQDFAAGYKLVERMCDSQKDNPMMQNALAWRILTDKAIEQRDLKLAEKLAERANEGTEGKNAAI